MVPTVNRVVPFACLLWVGCTAAGIPGSPPDGGAVDSGHGNPDAGGTPVAGACGSANGAATTVPPQSNLCSTGTASSVQGTGPWTWTCDGSGGGANASCSAPVPGTIDGVCGAATSVRTPTPPSTDLCDAGTPTAVTEVPVPGGDWKWTCDGSDGGTNAACTAQWPYLVGICGPANGVPSATPPDAGLCDGGIQTGVWANGVTGLPPFGWSCIGAGGGTSQTCLAPVPAPTGINGRCGGANDTPVASAPAANLCTAGAASPVTGAGPWSWTCDGTDGGSTAYCFAPPPSAGSVGTLQAGPAGGSNGTLLLLTDGTVMVANGGISSAWSRLKPDSSGSYASGTWSSMPSMKYSRLFFASAVLPDGRVFVGGGEYGTGTGNVEIYDPVANAWTEVPNWSGDIGDSTAEVLADGSVLLLPRLPAYGMIYDISSGAWTKTATKLGSPRVDVNDEESCVLLADGSVLTVDVNAAGGSQRYLPASNQWVSAGLLPVQLVNPAFEIGPGVLLYDGRAFFLGATGHTAFYSPTSDSWAAGPDIPQGLPAADAPAAVMLNGHVLFVAGSGSVDLFDFDPETLLYSQVASALGSSTTPNRMLVAPSGQVLMTGFNQMLVFTPNGSADPAWKPSISSVSAKGGAYLVNGIQLNGLTQGAYYGDDSQQASNYPLFQLVDGSGHVSYARSSNFSQMGVAPGAAGSATLDVTGIPAGSYSLFAVANGIASAPVPFTVR